VTVEVTLTMIPEACWELKWSGYDFQSPRTLRSLGHYRSCTERLPILRRFFRKSHCWGGRKGHVTVEVTLTMIPEACWELKWSGYDCQSIQRSVRQYDTFQQGF
jgi:hypothetical protein